MSTLLPDITRLQPTEDSLNVILKNTHFRDNILAAGNEVQLKIKYVMEMPLLIFKFSEPFYDFLEVLKFENFAVSNQEWLNKDRIVIRLVSSDISIADKLTIREFLLSTDESVHLRSLIQKQLSAGQIRKTDDYIRLHMNKLLQ